MPFFMYDDGPLLTINVMLKWHFRKKKHNVHHKWHSGTSGTYADDGKLLCLQKWYSSGNDSAGFLFFSFVRTEEHKPICFSTGPKK